MVKTDTPIQRDTDDHAAVLTRQRRRILGLVRLSTQAV